MTHSPTEHPRGVGSEGNERMSLLVFLDYTSLIYVSVPKLPAYKYLSGRADNADCIVSALAESYFPQMITGLAIVYLMTVISEVNLLQPFADCITEG